MKTLHLLRHAKSSWKVEDLADYDRPLSARGKRAARVMAAYFKREEIAADLVLVSTSRRTRDTWARVTRGVAGEPDIQEDPALYLAAEAELMRVLRARGGRANAVLLIAHNPGMHDLAISLAAEGEKDDLKRLAAKFPTAGFATIELDIGRWRDLAAGKGRLVRFVTPKEVAPEK
jgi:phosphohistidine phosphatase